MFIVNNSNRASLDCLINIVQPVSMIATYGDEEAARAAVTGVQTKIRHR
jgi:hypothetical protein